MLSPGTYFAKPIACSVEESGERKTPTFCIDLTVTHVADSGDWRGITEEKRTLFMYMSEGAWPYTQKDLERLGFNGDFDKPELSQRAHEGFEVRCAHEEYNGKTREKWSLAREGDREKKPLAKDQARVLAARWKTATQAAKPATGMPPAPPKAAAPVPAGASGSSGNEPPFMRPTDIGA